MLQLMIDIMWNGNFCKKGVRSGLSLPANEQIADVQ